MSAKSKYANKITVKYLDGYKNLENPMSSFQYDRCLSKVAA